MSRMEQAPTRSAVLDLKAERVVVSEAYDFLDEKRLLALVQAVARHGLQGLELYPADNIGAARFYTVISNFMGVSLADTGLQLPADDSAASAANPSPEVRACQALFHDLLLRASELAGVSGNLYRLLAEYRLTERRARALENVILPEIEQSLKVMTTHLEELEFEDAVRVRRQAGI